MYVYVYDLERIIKPVLCCSKANEAIMQRFLGVFQAQHIQKHFIFCTCMQISINKKN